MAAFNPEIPDLNPPNFFKYSEPIKDIKADTSTGLLLAGLGEGIDSLGKVATQISHDIIKKDVRESIEPIRDDFTKQLQTARAAVVPAPVSTGTGPSVGALSYTDEEPTPTPEGVKSGLDGIQAIQNALVSRKINDTYYHQRLGDEVQKIRTRYPAFTDLIDSEVAKITGVNPANALVGDLMQDINRALVEKKSEADKMLDLARTKGTAYDGGAKQYERLKADPAYGPQWLQWFNEEQVRDNQTARDKADIEFRKLSGAESEKAWVSNFSNWVSDKLSSNINSTIKLTGTDKPETIMEIMQRAANDPSYYKPEQMEEFATKLQAHRDIFRSQLIALSNAEKYPVKLGGAANRDAEIDSQLKYYDTMINAVRGGGAGGAGFAFFAQNQARAIMDRTRLNLTSGKMGDALNNLELINQKAGPGLAPQVIAAFLAAQKNLPEDLRGVFGEKAAAAIAQPGGENNPTTLSQHLTEINNDKRITKDQKPFLYEGLTKTVDLFKNPNASNDVKAAAARYLFDPSNNGVLQNWKMDYRTTSPDGRLQIVHPGKYEVWTKLTDKAVTDSIDKMDEKTKGYYRSWVDITGRDLIGQDVRTLNHFTGHDNLYFKWSNENGMPRLELKDKEGGLASPVGQTAAPYTGGFKPPITTGYRAQVQEVVDRINRALPNLEAVYSKMGGGNTEAMLLQTLKQYGMDFNGNVSGLPKAFGDSIVNSRKKPEEK